jgi:transposase
VGCAAVTGVGKRRPWEIEDGLWERIEPLLPVVERRYRPPGRRRLDGSSTQHTMLIGGSTRLRTGRSPWRHRFLFGLDLVMAASVRMMRRRLTRRWATSAARSRAPTAMLGGGLFQEVNMHGTVRYTAASRISNQTHLQSGWAGDQPHADESASMRGRPRPRSLVAGAGKIAFGSATRLPSYTSMRRTGRVHVATMVTSLVSAAC